MFRLICTTASLFRRTQVSRLLIALVVACGVSSLGPRPLPLGGSIAVADESPAAQEGDSSSGAEPLSLAVRQKQVAERFQRLEQLLLRLAEVEATENPERSALLRRAAKQSRESFILDRLSAASEALSGAQYQQAIDAQQSANENLAALLKLLLTEDRSERIRSEKDRITNWIKDLKREERKQRATRARTENGADLDAISDEQREILEQAMELQKQMSDDMDLDVPPEGAQSASERDDPESPESDSQESSDGAEQESLDDAKSQPPSSETETPESESADSPPSDDSSNSEQQPTESQPDPSEQSPSQQDPSEQSPSEQSPSEQSPSEQSPSEQSPSEQSPSEQSPGQSQPQQDPSQPQQPQTPQQEAEKKLQSAIERMKEAEQELEEAKREEATDRQRDAEKNLREAIDQLEKILRQLREEEMQRELARLEARLRKMAQMQSEVLDKTKALAEVPEASRDRQTDLQAGNLAGEEKKIVLEADRAMLLLREEGSSVAFPEVVQQIRGDMRTVADRLAQTKIDGITQGIQEDILAALEEMIAALQKAQRDLEEQKKQDQPPPQQAGEPGEQPLVESLAELKLIRTMQERIKGTTERYSEMIEQTDQAADRDFLSLLQSLADRQSRLSTITRDIALQRNR